MSTIFDLLREAIINGEASSHPVLCGLCTVVYTVRKVVPINKRPGCQQLLAQPGGPLTLADHKPVLTN